MVALRELPEDRVLLREVVVPVVLFIVLASTIVHGVTIPLTKFGPKALTRTRSSMSIASTNANHYFNRLRRRSDSNSSNKALKGIIRTQDISGPIGTAERDRGRSSIEVPIPVSSGSIIDDSRNVSRRTSFSEEGISSIRLESVGSSIISEGGEREGEETDLENRTGDVGRSILNSNSIITASDRERDSIGELGGSGNQMRVEFVLPWVRSFYFFSRNLVIECKIPIEVLPLMRSLSFALVRSIRHIRKRNRV